VCTHGTRSSTLQRVASAATIRPAVPGDATRLATFTRAVFAETYGAAIPSDMLTRYFDQQVTPAALAHDMTDAHATTLIASNDGAICATGRIAWQAQPSCVTYPDAMALSRFYVAAAQRGSGLAAALLAACEHSAISLGATHMWLCAWEHNPRALAFYQRNGYAIVGTAIVNVGAIAFQDHVLLKGIA
jgi:diamine N-acetyltransferase